MSKKRVVRDTTNVGNSTGVVPAGTVVWKVVLSGTTTKNWVLVKGLLVEDGIVPSTRGASSRKKFNAGSYGDCERKCRAPSMYVSKMFNTDDGKEFTGVGIASHDHRTEYRTGEVVKADFYDNNTGVTCAGGVHFFRTQEEAMRYASKGLVKLPTVV